MPKSNADILYEPINQLPSPVRPYLTQTSNERATSSRVAYARELDKFFNYLTNFLPDYANKEPKDFTLADIGNITSDQISSYITWLIDKGYAERTVARSRASISSFFTYLVNNRKIEYNPTNAAASVKIHKNDYVKHLEDEQQEELLDTASSGEGLSKLQKMYHDKYYAARDYALILLLLDTGIRVSELHSLNIKDIDFETSSFMFTRKGGNIQTLYFGDDVRSALLDYIDERKGWDLALSENDPLFVNRKGERLGIRAIQRLVNKYTSAAKVGKMSPHKLRASFAMSYYKHNGNDILALKKEMGHSNVTTTTIYASATDETLKNNRNSLSDSRRQH